MSSSKKWYWPEVDNRRNATFAIEEAFWAAILVSAIIVFRVAIALSVGATLTNAVGFVDAGIFGALAFEIKRKSRTAAVLTPILYLADFAYRFIVVRPTLPILETFVCLAFIQGVRGTFAYHKFPVIPTDLPTVEQGFAAMRAGSKNNEENAQGR